MIDARREAALKRKLNKLAKLSQEIDAEAKALYGSDAWVFAEAESGLHVMVGDDEGSGLRSSTSSGRRKHIRFSSDAHHALGVGAW